MRTTTCPSRSLLLQRLNCRGSVSARSQSARLRDPGARWFYTFGTGPRTWPGGSRSGAVWASAVLRAGAWHALGGCGCGLAGRGLLEYVVDGDQPADHQRGSRAHEGDPDGRDVADVADAEPDRRPAGSSRREGDFHVLVPDGPPEQHAKANGHALEYALEDRGGQRGVMSAGLEVGGDRGRREGDRHHEEQQQQVKEQERPVDLGEVLEQGMMINPDNPDGREADRVSGEGGPVTEKLVSQRLVTGTRSGHRQVQGQDRDRYGEDAVAERL